MIYESAQEFLKRKVASGEPVRLAQLRKEAADLETKRIDLSAKLDLKRQEQKDLAQAKENVEIIMSQEQTENGKDKNKERE